MDVEKSNQPAPVTSATVGQAELQALGNQLRERRRALGLTLSAVAASAGMAVGYLSMIERGRVARPPSGDMLARVAEALGLKAQALCHLAAWARAEAPVRDDAARAGAQAARGRALADWLQREGLDAALQSGELERRVGQVLNDMSTDSDMPSDIRLVQGLQQGAGSRLRTVPVMNKVAAGCPTGFTDLDYPARASGDYVAVHGVEDPDAFAAVVTGASMEPMYHAGDLVVFSPAAPVEDGCDCFAKLEPEHESTFKRLRIVDANTYDLVPLNPAFEVRRVARTALAGLCRAVAVQRRL